MADATGIPVAVVRGYESGRLEPTADVAVQVVTALGYRIELVPMLDPAVQARRLEDVLELAEALPYRPPPLTTPRR